MNTLLSTNTKAVLVAVLASLVLWAVVALVLDDPHDTPAAIGGGAVVGALAARYMGHRNGNGHA